MKTFLTNNGKKIQRLSRWITVKTNYNPNKNNALFDFSTDENGYTPDSENYDPKNGKYLDYFRFNGRNYALNQFICIGSIACPGAPYTFTENGENITVGGVDFSGDLYDPLYIEVDSYGEKVRIYKIL